MTTSKRISLLFAGYVTLLILIFGIVINTIFFVSWYRIIDMRLPNGWKNKITLEFNDQWWLSSQPQEIQLFDRFSRPMWRGQEPLIIDNKEFMSLLDNRKGWFDLIVYNDQIWHYRIDYNHWVVLTSVDGLIDSQLLLIYITLICAIVFAGISYMVSLWVVKRGLKPLYSLTRHIQQVQDPESYKHFVVWPDHDELQQVSSAFSHAMQTIASQTSRLKQFVTHASHELKTPLMTISSAVDVLKKKGENSPQIVAIKDTTIAMKSLIDRLMTTMRQDTLDEEPVDIIAMTNRIFDREQHLSPWVSIIQSFPKKLVLISDAMVLESLLTNLITNAYKYALPDTSIDITITTGKMLISNRYDTTQQLDIDMIREPFYRADSSRTDGTSHGLGLTIVRQLVDRLGWTITAQLQGDRILFTLIWSE